MFAVLSLMTASFLHAGNIHDIEVVPDDDFGYTVAPSVTSASTDPVGTIEGSFNVSHTGAAVYTMAIEAPKGLGEMQPTIGIAYNSQSGNGIAGWGTNITGFSVITRGMKDQFHDGGVKGMTFLADDAYFLDGKRLIYVSGTEGQEGAVYQLEGDPFTVITFHGYYNSVLADTWMDVRTPDGSYYEYGNSPTSRQFYTNKSGTSRIHAWYVSLQQDQDANYITYEYQTRNKYTYPLRINYGKNMNVSNSILNTINFSYDTNRMDSVEFVMEDTKGMLDVRLREITTQTNNDVFRTYSFLYNTTGDASTSKFSRLSQVTVSNGNNESLPATTFDWYFLPNYEQQVSAVNISLDDSDPQVQKQNMRFICADVNGDGIDDIIRVSDIVYPISYNQSTSGTGVYIYKSSMAANGTISYEPAYKYILPPSIIWDDWNFSNQGSSAYDGDGDGLTDLLFPYFHEGLYGNPCAINFRTITGKNIKNGQNVFMNTQLQILGTQMPKLLTGDFDSDGCSEIFALETSLVNNKYPARIIEYSEGASPVYVDLQFSLPNAPQKLFQTDFNNDGLLDFIVFYNGGYTIYYNNTGNNNVSRFSDSNKKTGTNVGAAWRMEQGDFNGDGQTDFLYVGGGSNRYYFALNNGDGTFTTTLALESTLMDQTTSKDNERFSLLVRDLDNDGKSDVIIVKTMYIHHGGIGGGNYFKETGVSWLLSDGSQLNEMRYVRTPVEDDSKAYNLMIGNFTGKGSTELMNYGCDLYTNTNASNNIELRRYKTTNYTAGTGKIWRITDGMENTTTINYTLAANVYTRYTDAQFPVVDVPVAFPMVRSVGESNGAASGLDFNYSYEGLKAHVQGKGLLGMTSVKKTCSQLAQTTENLVNWNSLYFIPEVTTTKTILGTDSIKTITDYQITPKPYNNYFAYPLSIQETDFDGNMTEKTYTYNTDFGYITSEITKFDGNNNLYKAIDYTGYVLKAGVYLPTSITYRQKYYSVNAEYSDRTSYTYDYYGHVTKEIKHADATLSLTTDRTYDSFGNVISSCTYGYGVTPLTEYFTYDTSGRFIASTYNSVVSSPICYTYNNWGNVTTETDNTFAPQTPQSIQYEYDGWGNLTKTTHADGTISTRTLGWGSELNRKYFVLEQGTATPWVETWYDSKGRKVYAKSIGFDDCVISENIQYNTKGKPISIRKRNGNLFENELIAYDSRGRIVSDRINHSQYTTSSYDKIIEYSYGNRCVYELRNGEPYSKHYDAFGNLIEAEDPVSTVEYTYNSMGKPIVAYLLADDTTLELEYDETGNRTSMTDSATGTIEYEYDALGRVMSQTDARGKTTCNNYNALGQLTASDVDGITTTYTYGTSGVDNMQLKKVITNGNSMEYTYDALRRVVHKKQTVDNLDILEYSYSYGANGLLSSKTYPNSLTENYQYDSYGNRVAMIVDNNWLWELQGSIGNIENSQIFSDLSLTRTYDNNGFLQNKVLKYETDTISYLSYSSDPSTGNLLSRSNGIREEFFEYDEIDRLERISVNNSTVMQLYYDCNGNITGKTGIGDYSYGDDNQHSVIGVDNINNLIPLTAQTISYNSFGKVQSIAEGNYGMTFVYGPDKERWKTVLTNNQTVARTTLYGEDYERITENGITKHFCYLEGGVLCVKQEGQSAQFYYMNTDHQGSIMSIVDEYGDDVFKADYDAWGKQTVTLNTIGFHRGYTGHEMLPEFGLINMNGRLYNPDLGRFLSPDNYVQAPDFSQNFNRYSYCLNNPLKYIDPSGESFAPILFGAIIGAAMAGTTYTLSTLMTGQSWNSHNFWKSIGLGAFSSALTAGISVAGSALGISAATTNTIGYKMMSQLSNSIITNVVFGNDISGSDLLGIVAGAALGSQLPDYVAKQGTVLKNFIGETLHNTITGAVTGMAQGITKTALKGDAKYLPQGIIGGAIGGLSKTLVINAILGTPYKFEGTKSHGTHRSGGIVGILQNYFGVFGEGVTIGKNAYVKNHDRRVSYHEDFHIQQIDKMGLVSFYSRIFKEYRVNRFLNSYGIKGTLENDADEYEKMMMGN